MRAAMAGSAHPLQGGAAGSWPGHKQPCKSIALCSHQPQPGDEQLALIKTVLVRKVCLAKNMKLPNIQCEGLGNGCMHGESKMVGQASTQKKPACAGHSWCGHPRHCLPDSTSTHPFMSIVNPSLILCLKFMPSLSLWCCVAAWHCQIP